uniref:Ovule protein n=1 Tax=Panagrolaimus sp. ES5 TaxID=591445 RepID=A0AC34F6U7_9BILA
MFMYKNYFMNYCFTNVFFHQTLIQQIKIILKPYKCRLFLDFHKKILWLRCFQNGLSYQISKIFSKQIQVKCFCSTKLILP